MPRLFFLMAVVEITAISLVRSAPARAGNEARVEREVAAEAQRSSALAQAIASAGVNQTVSPGKGWNEIRIRPTGPYWHLRC